MSESKEVAMVRTLHLDEMPYDEMLLQELHSIEVQLEAGPRRDAFRLLAMAVRMDINRGGVVRSEVMRAVLAELERLQTEEPGEIDYINRQISLHFGWRVLCQDAIDNIAELENLFEVEDKVVYRTLMHRAIAVIDEARALMQNQIECHKLRKDLLTGVDDG